MLETSHCGHIDARILFIGRLTSTLDNLSNRLHELWSVILKASVENYVYVCEWYFLNIDSEHLRVDFNIGILNILILLFIVVINVILITVTNLQ